MGKVGNLRRTLKIFLIETLIEFNRFFLSTGLFIGMFLDR